MTTTFGRDNVRRAMFALLALIAAFALVQLSATPANAAVPVITSAPAIDHDTFEAGDWLEFDGIDYTAPGDTDFFFQWYRCSATGGSCVKLTGETSDETRLKEDWVGKTLRLQVTICDEEVESDCASVTSEAVGPVIEAGPPPGLGGGILTSGNVQLGVNPTGNLLVDGGTPAAAGQNSPIVGLRYVPLNYESIADGSPAEGWGISDATSGAYAYANRDDGTSNIQQVSFVSTATTATSVVNTLGESGPVFEVTRTYAPTANANLYEATVAIKNISGADTDVRYREVVDWDVQPTPFDEYVTIESGNATQLSNVSNEGFDPTNPVEPLGGELGDRVDDGPCDCGAAFDFNFGTLANGATKTFKTYWGAAGNEADALDALSSVGAEAYSLGQSETPFGAQVGTPATFSVGFSGIGGDPAINTSLPDTTLTGHPAKYSTDDEPQFTFTSTATDFECALDDESFAACTSPQDYELDDGWHLFRVRAVDEGVDPTPATWQFKVDNTAPETDIDTTSPQPEVTANPKFEFESDGEDETSELTFECSVDEGAFEDCESPLQLTGLAPGDHLLAVRATDLAGNVEEAAAAYYWTYTPTAPPVTTILTSPGNTDASTLDITFEAAGAIDYYMCSFDGSGFDECESPFQITDLENGSHSFKVYAVAISGLEETTPKELVFTRGVAPLPGPPVVNPAKPSAKIGKPKKGKVKVTVTCGDATCKLAASVKVGKKKYRLKGTNLKQGSSTTTLAFGKKLKNALKKKGKKKATLSVTVSGSSGAKTATKKF